MTGWPTSVSARLQLGFAGARGLPVPHLSVDGMTPSGPNLSHWRGNRTPVQWKADLSTGIALRFSRAPNAEQEAFLGDTSLVVNDHYDTDGFGSLLAVLRPDLAIAREELLLAAAATGDFGIWQTWRGFAIDRIVARLAKPQSPVHGAFAGVVDSDELSLRRYAWLLEHATAVLDHPGGFAPLYAEEMAQVRNEIDQGQRGAIDRRRLPQLGLAVLTSQGTESWFELVTIQPMPRVDLRPLAQQLTELEPAHDGASWNADPPADPIPELWFGVPSAQAYGQITRELRASRLPAERVVAAFACFFAEATS
jgi:hypothetical protein